MRQNEYKIIAKKQTTSGDNQIAGIPNPYFRYYFVWLGYGPSQANVDEEDSENPESKPKVVITLKKV